MSATSASRASNRLGASFAKSQDDVGLPTTGCRKSQRRTRRLKLSRPISRADRRPGQVQRGTSRSG
jgi:hypothetical protein